MDSAKSPTEALLHLRRRNKNLIFLFLFFFFSIFVFSCAFVIYVFLHTTPAAIPQSIFHQYPSDALNVSLSTAATNLNSTMNSISPLLLHNHHSIPDLNNCYSLLRAALTQILYSLEEDDQRRKIATAEGAVKTCLDDLENVESSEVKMKVLRAYWSVRSSADLAAMVGDARNGQKKKQIVEWGEMIKEGNALPFLMCLVELQFIFFGFMFWILCRFRWPFRK